MHTAHVCSCITHMITPAGTHGRHAKARLHLRGTTALRSAPPRQRFIAGLRRSMYVSDLSASSTFKVFNGLGTGSTTLRAFTLGNTQPKPPVQSTTAEREAMLKRRGSAASSEAPVAPTALQLHWRQSVRSLAEAEFSPPGA